MNAIHEPIVAAEVRPHNEHFSLQSRWGFHVCDHAVYLKLKAIKKAYFQALKQSADYRRWGRKTVTQHEFDEPVVNPVFAIGRGVYEKKSYPDGKGGRVTGLRWNPNPVTPGPFLNLFDQARKPHATRVEPFDSLILGAIDEKYGKLRSLGYV